MVGEELRSDGGIWRLGTRRQKQNKDRWDQGEEGDRVRGRLKREKEIVCLEWTHGPNLSYNYKAIIDNTSFWNLFLRFYVTKLRHQVSETKKKIGGGKGLKYTKAQSTQTNMVAVWRGVPYSTESKNHRGVVGQWFGRVYVIDHIWRKWREGMDFWTCQKGWSRIICHAGWQRDQISHNSLFKTKKWYSNAPFRP